MGRLKDRNVVVPPSVELKMEVTRMNAMMTKTSNKLIIKDRELLS
jgi:hypothetical protein